MPLEYLNGKPCITGIPRGSSLCISALPSRREVISTRASGSFTPAELDPGKYAYTVQKHPLFNNPSRMWTERGEFLVDVNEDEFQRLLNIRPRFAKSVMTTKGARWDCGVTRCSEQFTSAIAAIQHEGEHLGIDFLHTSIDEAEDALMKVTQAKQLEPKEPPVNPRVAVGLSSPADVIDAAEHSMKEQPATNDPSIGLHRAADRRSQPAAK